MLLYESTGTGHSGQACLNFISKTILNCFEVVFVVVLMTDPTYPDLS